MIETQLARMQRLSIERLPACRVLTARRQLAPIQRIANQRMAKVLEVHANLMRATRFKPAREPRNFGRRTLGLNRSMRNACGQALRIRSY